MNVLIIETGNLELENNALHEHLMKMNSEDARTVLFLFDLLSYRDDVKINFKKLKEFHDYRSQYRMIPIEEVWEYWYSWSLGDAPSRSLEFLKNSGWLELYPELFGSLGVIQNPETHPEGDVFTHILYAVDEAAKIAERESLDDRDRSLLVFSALCHDLGKQVSYGKHEISGVPIAEKFLTSISAPMDVKEYVKKLVLYHSSDYYFAGKKLEKSDITKDFVVELQNCLYPASIPMLVLLHEADVNGRGNIKVFEDRVSPNYRIILSTFFNESENLRKFTVKDFYKLSAENSLLESLKFSNSVEIILINRVNQLIDEGFCSLSEIKYFLPMIFNADYMNAIEFVESMDYRTLKKFSNEIESNGYDLDSLLIQGPDKIKEILNTSPE